MTSVLGNDILCLQTKLGKEAIIIERNEILKKAQAERVDLSATVSASVFAGMTYRFIKTKKKENAIIALVMLSVVVIATISFFMEH